MMSIPEELQEKVVQFEQMRQQIQIISSQRLQMEAEEKEIVETLEVLGTITEGTPVYKKAGNIMVKVDDIGKLKDELSEHQETMSVRVKSLKGQEDATHEAMEKLQNYITEQVNKMQMSNINLSGPKVG